MREACAATDLSRKRAMAKQLTADEGLNLKRQARRRLIGAVALTTAVVVILPVVFDSEPPPAPANNIELRIPDKDKVGAFQAVTPVEAPASAVVATPAASAVSVVMPASAPIVSAPVAPLALEVKQEAKTEEAAVKPKKVEPETKTEPKVKSEAKPKVEPKPKVEAKAKTDSKAAVPHSGYVIQVGVYSNHALAKNMQEKLSKQGFRVYSEKVPENNNLRVRVGSYPTREAAEKIRRKLEALGLRPNLVNLGN